MSWSSDSGSIIHDRKTYGLWTVWKQAGGFGDESLADDDGGVGSGRGVLRHVVLAAARLARVPRGNSRGFALAMAGGCSVGAWICSSPTLCLGLRMDRTRHTRARCTANAINAVGFYRCVRNTMYLGFAAGWIRL